MIRSIPLTETLVVVYQIGVTPLGAPVLRQKSLSGVRFNADEEALYNAAHTLFALSQYPVIDVMIRKTYKLAEE